MYFQALWLIRVLHLEEVVFITWIC